MGTYLERDLPSLGINISTMQIRRLWTMLAYASGQIVNYSKLSESLGISRNTVRNYIHILEQIYMVRILQPWFSNLKKRLVKAPKVTRGFWTALADINPVQTWIVAPVDRMYQIDNERNVWVGSILDTVKGIADWDAAGSTEAV